MATPRIYQSSFPPIPTNNKSVYTYLFRDNDVYPPSALAYIDAATGESITRGRLKALTLALGYGLRNNVKLPPSPLSPGNNLARGDVVMIFSPNSLSWPIALFGAVAAGLKLTLASSASTALELSWQWTDSRARMLIAAPSHVPVAIEMFKLLGLTEEDARAQIWVMNRLWDPPGAGSLSSADGFKTVSSLLGRGSLDEEERFDGPDADETLYICYSSGTTGRPKGVESSHRGAGSILSMAWTLFKSIKTDHDVSLALLPFYHIFGLIAHLHHSFYIGIPTVFLTQGFEPGAFCKAVSDYKVTMVMVAPPILQAIIHHPAADKYNLTSLRAFISGAAPLSPALVRQTISKLSQVGAHPKIINGYGSTETTLTVTVVPPEAWESKFSSVGVLAPNLEVRIVREIDGEDGRFVDVEEGEPGELWIKGPTIMKGYLYNAGATAESIREGWYMTGDILRRDTDGYFYVVDRKKELIKYKGLQIAPAELEAVLLEHPQVKDVGVIGIQDTYSGNELPRAYVVPNNPAILDSPNLQRQLEADVKGWIAGKVARYKQLRGGVVVTEAIPKSPTGKILRRELRSLSAATTTLGRVVGLETAAKL